MPYAEQAKAKGIKIFHLNIGQPDVPSPPEFWQAIQGANLKVLEYSHAAGSAELREKVASAYRAMNLPVETKDLIVTTAGSEAVAFAMQVVCDSGDEVIIPEPMYANYIGFSTAVGVRVVPIPTKIEENFALPGIEEFEKRITPKTKAIVICNPGNPTGTVYSDRQLEELADLALAKNLFIISDEVYREFSYLGHPPKSVLQIERLAQHCVMCDSVSKRFSLCGARIGFLVSKNQEVMGAALKYAQARLSPPTLESIGVLGALQAPASYFEGVRAEYKRRRDLLVERLRGIPGVLCPDIQGAFYATVRLPIDDSDRFCQWLLESFNLDGRTVMLAPATGFYETKGSGVDEVRIAYVLKEENLALAMDCLTEALKVYPGTRQAAKL
jgi:aspartate aminotransferase